MNQEGESRIFTILAWIKEKLTQCVFFIKCSWLSILLWLVAITLVGCLTYLIVTGLISLKIVIVGLIILVILGIFGLVYAFLGEEAMDKVMNIWLGIGGAIAGLYALYRLLD